MHHCEAYIDIGIRRVVLTMPEDPLMDLLSFTGNCPVEMFLIGFKTTEKTMSFSPFVIKKAAKLFPFFLEKKEKHYPKKIEELKRKQEQLEEERNELWVRQASNIDLVEQGRKKALELKASKTLKRDYVKNAEMDLDDDNDDFKDDVCVDAGVVVVPRHVDESLELLEYEKSLIGSYRDGDEDWNIRFSLLRSLRSKGPLLTLNELNFLELGFVDMFEVFEDDTEFIKKFGEESLSVYKGILASHEHIKSLSKEKDDKIKERKQKRLRFEIEKRKSVFVKTQTRVLKMADEQGKRADVLDEQIDKIELEIEELESCVKNNFLLDKVIAFWKRVSECSVDSVDPVLIQIAHESVTVVISDIIERWNPVELEMLKRLETKAQVMIKLKSIVTIGCREQFGLGSRSVSRYVSKYRLLVSQARFLHELDPTSSTHKKLFRRACFFGKASGIQVKEYDGPEMKPFVTFDEVEKMLNE